MEYLLLLLVIFICLGPKQAKQLAYWLGRTLSRAKSLREQFHQLLLGIQNEKIYQENLSKAEAAEKMQSHNHE